MRTSSAAAKASRAERRELALEIERMEMWVRMWEQQSQNGRAALERLRARLAELETGAR